MRRGGKRVRVKKTTTDSFKVERPQVGRFVIVTVDPGSTSEIRYSIPKEPLGLPSDRTAEHARA